MSRELKISVTTEAGDAVVVTINNPKDDVNADEVRAFAEIMQNGKIHTFKGGDIAKIKGAKIVTKNKKKFAIY